MKTVYMVKKDGKVTVHSDIYKAYAVAGYNHPVEVYEVQRDRTFIREDDRVLKP